MCWFPLCCALPTWSRRGRRSCVSLCLACLGHCGCCEGAGVPPCLPNPLCTGTTCSLGNLLSQFFLLGWQAHSLSCWVVKNIVGALWDALPSWFAHPAASPLHSSALLSSAGCSLKKKTKATHYQAPTLNSITCTWLSRPQTQRSELSVLVALDWEPGNHQCDGAAGVLLFGSSS